ncbi:MAG: Hsp20/alpha crystallin family protein [Clostridia bacterium]|nr:Hsp20/alpha crystallin family protein [Clostridia bacterium]
MSIIKYNPSLIDDIFDDFWGGNLPTRSSISRNIPAVDIYDDKENIYIDCSLNGISPEDVSCEIENGILTLKGNSEKKKEIDEKNYYRKEISMGGFMRQIALPVEVDSDKAEAVFNKGLLKITVPKSEKTKAKKIDIKH